MFSGPGVGRLRHYLNQDQNGMSAVPGVESHDMFTYMEPADGPEGNGDADREDDMEEVDDTDLIQLNVGPTPSPGAIGTPIHVPMPMPTQQPAQSLHPPNSQGHGYIQGPADTLSASPNGPSQPFTAPGLPGPASLHGAQQVTNMMADVEMQDRDPRATQAFLSAFERGDSSRATSASPSPAPSGSRRWDWNNSSTVAGGSAGASALQTHFASPPAASRSESPAIGSSHQEAPGARNSRAGAANLGDSYEDPFSERQAGQ